MKLFHDLAKSFKVDTAAKILDRAVSVDNDANIQVVEETESQGQKMAKEFESLDKLPIISRPITMDWLRMKILEVENLVEVCMSCSLCY